MTKIGVQMNIPTETKLLKFLKDKNKSYNLNFSQEKVFASINNIPKSYGLWSTTNIILKYFDGKNFTIELIRMNADVTSPKLASQLFGEIEKRDENETFLRTTIKCRPGIYILLIICILAGLIFLGKFFFFNGDILNVFWAILMLGLFPYLLVWFKKVSDVAITENFEDYLFNDLKN